MKKKKSLNALAIELDKVNTIPLYFKAFSFRLAGIYISEEVRERVMRDFY